MASASTPPFRLSSNQTALALVVPSHLQPEINTLRKIHDKAYRKWEPHINILYPFVGHSLLSSAVSGLRTHLSSHPISPFKVKIEDVGTFEHRRNATVFLKSGEESEEKIRELRKQLVGALGRDESEGTHDGVFKPHLTVGQAALTGSTKERLVEKVGKLVGLEWEVERLAVLRREATGEMTVIEEILLRDSEDGEYENDSHFLDDGWRMCFHFSLEMGWKQLSRKRDSPYSDKTGPIKVTIASFNLMSEPHVPQFSTRLPQIVEAISKSMALSSSSFRVLCLQEVDEEMLPLLLQSLILQELFPYSTHSPSSLLPSKRNIVTLSSERLSCYTIQFAERHKSALVISFYDLPVQVVNVHLTSSLTDEAVTAKRSQMETLTQFLMEAQTASGKNIFVAGDFNLTSSSKTIETALSQKIITSETARSVRGVIDAGVWDDAFVVLGSSQNRTVGEELYEGEEGATFDRLTNPLASVSKTLIDNRPQRYDRILFRKDARICPLHFKIFGRPTGNGTCWSDHYGICAAFQMEGMREGVDAKHPSPQQPVHRIKITEDSTDVQTLIDSYLPTEADRKQREEALALLQKTLSQSKSLKDLIVAPLGSYAMNTYFADSDVDVLAIASVSPQVFFDFATEQLRALDSPDKKKDGGFKGVHFVNSLVSIIEVNILGIKFDIQYCQAPELLNRYQTHPQPSLDSLVSSPALLQTLSPSSLRPINTYRSTLYLLATLPNLSSYRISHRFLALYLKHHGLYSAKFGYLGGIHLSLLLNHLIKSITSQETRKSVPSGEISLSPATIIRTFFEYYSTFDWTTQSVLDPCLGKENKTPRTLRDAIFIPALHAPTARPNVAASCTRLSALTITSQFQLATRQISRNNFTYCLRPKYEAVSEFLNEWGAYIRVAVQMWDLDVDGVSGERVREVVGGIESRVIRLLVSLGRIEVEGRVWPERFWDGNEEGEGGGSGEEGLKGWYIIGIRAKEESGERKRVLNRKVVSAVREFEVMLRGAREIREAEGNVWVAVDLVAKKKILDMGIMVDGRGWKGREEGLAYEGGG